MGTGCTPSPGVGGQRVCALCGGRSLEVVVPLPDLPLTDTFADRPMTEPGGISQDLLACPGCGHAQLSLPVDPARLYGNTYHFRTSASESARRGTALFLGLLDEVAPGRRFRCAVDIGCNDLHLLRLLKPRCAQRVGVDPLWSGAAMGKGEEDIRVLGCPVEEAKIGELPEAPDLILCRHTMEHLRDPRAVLTRLLQASSPDAIFLFEIPDFAVLLDRLRFDQVFHQHLHYFSLPSLTRLLGTLGCSPVACRRNYHDWGSMSLAFAKRSSRGAVHDVAPATTPGMIRERYRMFQGQMEMVRRLMEHFRGTGVMYGYGAAQMLPVLAYHLHTDLAFLKAVLDDNPAKAGLCYANLPVTVRASETADDLPESTVVITAVDNVAPILQRLLARRPRQILCPAPAI